jgi:branched-chain amino acid transport system ATP-binding protein
VTLLVLDNVERRFEGLRAVAGVSFSVPPACITGLIGPNGSGKTTLINLISGMLSISSGNIVFDGNDISMLPPHKVARMGIARTFQNIRLLRDLSVRDNIVVGFHRHEQTNIFENLFGFPAACRERKEFRNRAELLMKRLTMIDYADTPAGQLSYGHQRKVEIMRAIAASPALLLLDEPVAGMNDVEAHELGHLLRELAADGIAILLVEHNMRFVMSLCENIHVMNSGQLIASGRAETVIKDPAVITAYLGVSHA